MRKRSMGLWMLALGVSLGGCSAKKPQTGAQQESAGQEETTAETPSETKSLYARGLEVAELMSELIRTEEYVDLLSGNDELKEIVQDIGAGDYSAPKAVYSISVTEENLAAFASMEGFDSLDGVSDRVRSFMIQKIYGSLVTVINARSGADRLAASSIGMAGKMFVDPDADGNRIYLYTYEDALPIAVTFTVGEDHAVSANGVFVMDDEFTCGCADEIEAYFNSAGFGYIPVDAQEVLPEAQGHPQASGMEP